MLVAESKKMRSLVAYIKSATYFFQRMAASMMQPNFQKIWANMVRISGAHFGRKLGPLWSVPLRSAYHSDPLTATHMLVLEIGQVAKEEEPIMPFLNATAEE